DRGGSDAGDGDPPPEGSARDAAEVDAGGGPEGGADAQDENPAGDGALVLAVQGEDLGGLELEDGRVVEDRTERGESGDGQEGGQAHGGGGEPPGPWGDPTAVH